MRTLSLAFSVVLVATLGNDLAFAFGASPAPERPQESLAAPSVRFTLDEAVARAFNASHRLAEVRAREEGARASVAGRQAADRPHMTVLAGHTRTNHVDQFGIALPNRPFQVIYPDIPNNFRARLDMTWPIFTFGRTAAAERAAVAEVAAVGKEVEAAHADLKLDVTRAFWGAVTARESVRVLEESLKRMDASLQDVRSRRDAGLVPPNDVLSVQAQRSRQQMLLIQARNQSELVLADLSRLVGLPAGSRIELDAALDAPRAPDAAGQAGEEAKVTELIAQAKSARPDRQALARRVTQAGERQQLAMAARRPTLGVGAGLDYARPNPRIFPRLGDFRQSWDAGISFSWSLWDGGRARADIAEAAAGQRAVAERLAEFDSVIEVEVRQRWLEVESGKAAIDAARDAVIAAAEARRVVGDRFAAGVATSTEVLDAQVALLQAELDRTQALASLRLAEARLDRAVGR